MRAFQRDAGSTMKVFSRRIIIMVKAAGAAEKHALQPKN